MNNKPDVWADFVADQKKWKELARQELDGVDPFEKLSLEKGKIKILPYYDKNDLLHEGDFFSLSPAADLFPGARSWINAPRVPADDNKANEKALKHLNAGAEGVLFEMTDRKIAAKELLNGIDLRYCHVFFRERPSSSFREDFFSYAKDQYGQQPVNCSFFLNDPDKTAHAVLNDDLSGTIHSLGLLVEEKNSAEETISHALRDAVSVVDRLTDRGHSPASIFGKTAFSVSIGTDFFLEIAKLKTLRFLFGQIASAYQVETPLLHIHAFSPAWINENFQPHGNLIKSTTSALAAILGGCNSLTIEPEENGNGTMERIARNVSLLLLEESHLAKVADPLAGSYYIEKLTRELTEQSWSHFQNLVTHEA